MQQLLHLTLSYGHSECNRVKVFLLTQKVPKTKIVALAKSVEPDEVAHHEMSHLELHCCHILFYLLV